MMRIRRLAVAAIPAGIIGTVAVLAATVLPAAATTGSICTVFDQHLCIGDPGIIVSPGDQVETVNPPGRTMVFAPGPGGTGTIRFKNFSLCLALPNSNSDNVIVEECSARGVSYTWVDNGSNGHFFVNQLTGLYLTGFNTVGGIVAVCQHPCPAGGDQAWNGP